MKIFAVSDIHGFYDEFIDAINKAGFEKNNENHLLVICGDLWDRGKKPQEVMDYLLSVKNKVMIMGNHELLIQELVERGYPLTHDFSNGTAGTVLRLGSNKDFTYNGYCFDGITDDDFKKACKVTQEKIEPVLKTMYNYFETKNYIFVHSWIPCIGDGLPIYYTRNRNFEYDENWRTAHFSDWVQAMWGNPWNMADRDLNKTGKTIVFGHWHTSHFWAKQDGTSEFGEDACFDIAHDKKNNVIGLDACTVHSEKVNVLVLEDEL